MIAAAIATMATVDAARITGEFCLTALATKLTPQTELLALAPAPQAGHQREVGLKANPSKTTVRSGIRAYSFFNRPNSRSRAARPRYRPFHSSVP